MNGFSAHPDQRDLRDSVGGAKEGGMLKSVILVHGEPAPQKILAGLLAEDGVEGVVAPGAGERIAL